MYRYSIIHKGATLDLSGVIQRWQVLSVTGLNPPMATQNESNVVGVPGVKIVGSNIGKRAIVITLKVNNPCELNRAEILRYLAPNNEITVKIQSKYKTLYIDGVVEYNDYDIYTQSQLMQVSILCGYPYFKSSDDRVSTSLQSSGGFMFPFSVDIDEFVRFDEMILSDYIILYNYGQIQTGLQIELKLYNNSSNIKLYNLDKQDEYIGLKGDFYSGDIIRIDTNINAKKRAVLIRNGEEINILRRLIPGSKWLKINDMLVVKFEGNAYLTITNHDELAGI